MSKSKKKIIAIGIVILLILLGILLLLRFTGDEEGLQKATLQDLLDSESVRNDVEEPIVVSSDSSYMALAATPAAVTRAAPSSWAIMIQT